MSLASKKLNTSAPPIRPPLGLPSGSVRALLALLVVAVVITRAAAGAAIEPLWTETLMIVLAHYFSSRRFLALSPAAIQRLEAEGVLEAEAHPLYLPRYSIRISLLLAFVGLAMYLAHEGRLFTPESVSLLGVVFAYLLGIVASTVLAWWMRGRPTPMYAKWEDAKALVVLLVMLCTAAAYLMNRPDLIPERLRDATLGLVLFYFGSR